MSGIASRENEILSKMGFNNGVRPIMADTNEIGFSDVEETVCGSDPLDDQSFCHRGLPWLMLLLEDEY